MSMRDIVNIQTANIEGYNVEQWNPGPADAPDVVAVFPYATAKQRSSVKLQQACNAYMGLAYAYYVVNKARQISKLVPALKHALADYPEAADQDATQPWVDALNATWVTLYGEPMQAYNDETAALAEKYRKDRCAAWLNADTIRKSIR